MFKGIVLIAALVTLGACSNTGRANEDKVTQTKTETDTTYERQAVGKTADQAGQNKTDVEITRQIRQALVKDESLSTNAHNIKIITQNKKVVLKGLVNSAAEKAKVESIARASQASATVESQLEISKK